jgi:Holliday junction resolvase RusA-like endonuclease
MSLRFTIPGEPQAWQRAGGRNRRFNPAEMTQHARTIRAYADLAIRDNPLRAHFPLSGHVWLGAAFYQGCYTRKFKHAGSVQIPYDSDLDNLLKLVADALRKIAFHDDKQIRGYLPGTKKVLCCEKPHTLVCLVHENEMTPELLKACAVMLGAE